MSETKESVERDDLTEGLRLLLAQRVEEVEALMRVRIPGMAHLPPHTRRDEYHRAAELIDWLDQAAKEIGEARAAIHRTFRRYESLIAVATVGTR